MDAPKDHAPSGACAVESVRSPRAPRRHATYITVTSGKGGVGKTNVAINLCAALALQGRRVTMIDADLGTANADVLCGLQSAQNVSHFIAGRRARLDEIAVDAPGGFRLVAGANGLRRMANLDESQRAHFIRGVTQLEQSSDVVVLDTSAGINQSVTAMAGLADIVLLVLTPEPTSIADGYGLIKSIHAGTARGRRPITGAGRGSQSGSGIQNGTSGGTGIELENEGGPNLGLEMASAGEQRIAVLVNMASSRTQARAVYDRVAMVARRFLHRHLDFAGWIPKDPMVGQAVLHRRPVLLESPRCPASRALSGLGESLLGSIEPERERGADESPSPHNPRSDGYFARFCAWLGAGA